MENTLSITITNHLLHPIDNRMFGHFLERASFGEPGPEKALLPGTRQLQPSVLDCLHEMRPPVMRFPGGTDVDYLDWRDLIGLGERPVSRGHSGREITNNFGYDEFLRLCETLPSQPLLVLNFRDALLRNMPLPEAALHAAGLVAYCNAPVGAALPDGMPDWPTERARNGHLEPYRVPYFQIGNETWFYWQDPSLGMTDEEAAAWYITCLAAFVEAMRAVDPAIEIIVDGEMPAVTPIIRERLGTQVQYLAHHTYTPGPFYQVQKDGIPYPLDEMTPEELWLAWTGVPGIDPETGVSVDTSQALADTRRYGYRAAVTEWNWNGWAGHGEQHSALDPAFPSAVGAAGFLHAFLRNGDIIDIGCRSMLVGVAWKGIAAVWADPAGITPASFQPSGLVTMFYARHHGTHRLDITHDPVPAYMQPFTMGWLQAPVSPVAYLDLVATGSDDRIFLHAINRRFDAEQPIAIDLSAFPKPTGRAVHHLFTGSITEEAVEFSGSILEIVLPAKSVSIIEIYGVR